MSEINAADTGWLMVSTALVLLMTPGLALFYGGMVHAKNVLSTVMHGFFALGMITLQWVIIGYSLSFDPSIGDLLGNLDHVLPEGVGLESKDGVPHLLFMAFQMMFAIITPALISGLSPSASSSPPTWSPRCCGPRSSTIRTATGSGAPRVGCEHEARWTSPAVPSELAAPEVEAHA